MDAISEKRLLEVHPEVAFRVKALEQALGFSLRVTQGKRTPNEQQALWMQGRTTTDVVNKLREEVGWAPLSDYENKIVTRAPQGHSWHEYGLCVDVVPIEPDGSVDFNESHPQWQAIVNQSRDFKLLDGISFQDEPHLQPIELPISPTPKFLALLVAGIQQDIWDAAGLVTS